MNSVTSLASASSSASADLAARFSNWQSRWRQASGVLPAERMAVAEAAKVRRRRSRQYLSFPLSGGTSQPLDTPPEPNPHAIQIAHGVPTQSAETVVDLARRLFAAYDVENGSVALAGCTLEHRAVLWLVFRVTVAGPSPQEFLIEEYIGPQSQALDPALIHQLGADEILPFEKPPRLTTEETGRLVDLSQRIAENCKERIAAEIVPTVDSAAEERPAVKIEVLSATVVWCNYAEGKLRFTIGNHVAETPFADWAATLEAPPFVCPVEGVSSFRLAATGAGPIVAAESLAACAKSGERVLRRDLATCTLTGERVLPRFVQQCPMSGETVLVEQLVRCPVCHVEVSPRALTGAEGACCPAPAEVTSADPRLVRAWTTYPKLEAWNYWRLAETPVVYVLIGAGLMSRLLVVLDKDTLEPRRLATGRRFSKHWTDVEPAEYHELLGAEPPPP